MDFVKPLVSSGRVVYVDANDGTSNYADYSSIQDAIDFAESQSPSESSPYVILVRAGLYEEDLTFKPHINIVGWSGDQPEDDKIIRVRASSVNGFGCSLPNVGDKTNVVNIHIEGTIATANALVTKTGFGTLGFYSCTITSEVGSVGQGATIDHQEGDLNLDHTKVVANDGGDDLNFAYMQSGQNTNLFAKDCTFHAPSCLEINNLRHNAQGVLANFERCDLISTGGVNSFAVRTGGNCSFDHSFIETNTGKAYSVNPTPPLGNTISGNIVQQLRWSFVDGDFEWDIDETLGANELRLGSVEYGSFSQTGTASAPPYNVTRTALIKGDSLYYDNSTTAIAADNVQDAIDAVHGIASTAVQSASNVGTGQGAFKQKAGTDLEFKSFTGGTDISVTPVGDDLEISYTGGGLISSNQIIEDNSSVTVIDNGIANGTITFTIEGTDVWQIDGSGHLLPLADSTYNLGDATHKVLNVYTDTLIATTEVNTPKVDSATGVGLTLAAGGTDYWQVEQTSGHLIPQGASSTQDIGGLANRVQSIYVDAVSSVHFVHDDGVTVHDWALNVDITDVNNPVLNFNGATVQGASGFSGNYNDLTNRPSDLSDFNNDLTLNSFVNDLTSVDWSIVTSTPTTIAGYGITDSIVLSDTAIDNQPVRQYYANQAAFPSATDWHGAIAHSHSDGAMYFAHGSSWNKLANASDIPTDLTDLGIADGSNGQVLTTDGVGGFSFTTVSSGSGVSNTLDTSYAAEDVAYTIKSTKDSRFEGFLIENTLETNAYVSVQNAASGDPLLDRYGNGTPVQPLTFLDENPAPMTIFSSRTSSPNAPDGWTNTNGAANWDGGTAPSETDPSGDDPYVHADRTFTVLFPFNLSMDFTLTTITFEWLAYAMVATSTEKIEARLLAKDTNGEFVPLTTPFQTVVDVANNVPTSGQEVGYWYPVSISAATLGVTSSIPADKILLELQITIPKHNETLIDDFNQIFIRELKVNGTTTFYNPAQSGIGYTDLSVTTAAASGIGSLSYINTNGVFVYTPPDRTEIVQNDTKVYIDDDNSGAVTDGRIYFHNNGQDSWYIDKSGNLHNNRNGDQYVGRLDLPLAGVNSRSLFVHYDFTNTTNGLIKFESVNLASPDPAMNGFFSLEMNQTTKRLEFRGNQLAYNSEISASGIAYTDLSVTTSGTPSGGGSLSYNNTNGAFTFTPAVEDSISDGTSTLDFDGSNNLQLDGGHFLPTTNELQDLGSATNKWRDLYISTNTIYMGENALSLDVTDPADKHLKIDGVKIPTKFAELLDVDNAATATEGHVLKRRADGRFEFSAETSSGAGHQIGTDDTSVTVKDAGATGSSVTFKVDNTNTVRVVETGLLPVTSASPDLGSSTKHWKDIHTREMSIYNSSGNLISAFSAGNSADTVTSSGYFKAKGFEPTLSTSALSEENTTYLRSVDQAGGDTQHLPVFNTPPQTWKGEQTSDTRTDISGSAVVPVYAVSTERIITLLSKNFHVTGSTNEVQGHRINTRHSGSTAGEFGTYTITYQGDTSPPYIMLEGLYPSSSENFTGTIATELTEMGFYPSGVIMQSVFLDDSVPQDTVVNFSQSVHVDQNVRGIGSYSYNNENGTPYVSFVLSGKGIEWLGSAAGGGQRGIRVGVYATKYDSVEGGWKSITLNSVSTPVYNHNSYEAFTKVISLRLDNPYRLTNIEDRFGEIRVLIQVYFGDTEQAGNKQFVSISNVRLHTFSS